MRVLKATDYLLNVTINQFATWLDDSFLSINLEDPLSNLTELIHREGINCRYLGILRKRLSHDYPRELVLNEMIARFAQSRCPIRAKPCKSNLFPPEQSTEK